MQNPFSIQNFSKQLQEFFKFQEMHINSFYGALSFYSGFYILKSNSNDLIDKISVILFRKFLLLIEKILHSEEILEEHKRIFQSLLEKEACSVSQILPSSPVYSLPLLVMHFNMSIIQYIGYLNSKFCEMYYQALAEAIAKTTSSGKSISANLSLTHYDTVLLKFMLNKLKAYFKMQAVLNASKTDLSNNMIESAFANIQKGGSNFYQDVIKYPGIFRISTCDNKQFKIGCNIATTEGKVIFENDLLQLIMYKPLNAELSLEPILIIPAWINKYYILDLQDDNSFVKYILGNKHAVFMISWVNPDSSLANKGFEDYLLALEEAFMQVTAIAEGAKVNCVGYCLGGTVLMILAAYFKQKNIESINTITLLTTMVDFRDTGDIEVFICDEILELIENEMKIHGLLSGNFLFWTFSFLKSYEMIWHYVVNNYIMGLKPTAFDILFWNDDSTNITQAAHSFYLRNLYRDNLLAKGELILKGNVIDLKLIDQPIYCLAAEDDNIAPWQTVYRGFKIYNSCDKKFVLTQSGHVAGILNSPKSSKYGYYVIKEDSNNKDLDNLDNNLDLIAKAKVLKKKSWWSDWITWLEKRDLGEKKRCEFFENANAIESAPGRYVRKSFFTTS